MEAKNGDLQPNMFGLRDQECPQREDQTCLDGGHSHVTKALSFKKYILQYSCKRVGLGSHLDIFDFYNTPNWLCVGPLSLGLLSATKTL